MQVEFTSARGTGIHSRVRRVVLSAENQLEEEMLAKLADYYLDKGLGGITARTAILLSNLAKSVNRDSTNPL